MSPIIGLTPFVLSMASPRVLPIGRITVSEVLQAIRVSSNHAVIVDARHLETEPSPVDLKWLEGVSHAQGVAIHLLGKGRSQTFHPKARPLPDMDIPEDLARALLEDIVRTQEKDPSGKKIVEIYGETATEALMFLMNRPETRPLLESEEGVPGDLARPLVESVFKLLQYAPSGERVADTYGERAVGPLLFLMTQFPDLLAAALRSLGRIGGPRIAPHIVRHLENKDPVARSAAVQALGRMRAAGAAGDLWRICVDEGECSLVRREAAAALGLLGLWDLLPRLTVLLEAESDFSRLLAARALGWYSIPMGSAGPEKGGTWPPYLENVLAPALAARLEDLHFPVIAQAAWSLGKLKARSALLALENLKSHPDWMVRRQAHTAVLELKKA